MIRSCVVPLLSLVSGCAVAQSFEAASVKPVQLMDLRDHYKPLEGGSGSKTPTRIAGHINFSGLVILAYGVKSSQVAGPSWMDMEFYEIFATVPSGATKEQQKVMWQNLLRERFHMQTHRETRALPALGLVTGKNGPRFKESDPAAEAADKEATLAVTGRPRPAVTAGPDGFPQIPPDAKLPGSFTLSLSNGDVLKVKMFCRHMTMAELADQMSSFAGRVVEDQTGLNGKYDFTLAFETERRQPVAWAGEPAEIPVERGADLFTAVQEQLGLKLEAKRSNIEMLVIDRVEKTPTEN
jgi:uncharacterized protein (TIGR03435 family)